MKRCPQCDFIYLDTDEVCDLDGAELIVVDESELGLNQIPKPKPGRSNLRRTIVMCAGGALLLALLTAAYLFSARTRQQTQAQTPTLQVQQTPPMQATVAVAPTPESSPSPQAPVIASTSSRSPVEQPKRAALSNDPVSTSSDSKEAGQIWIRLSNGARIEADEVWRTKEGVWYRRNGVVTLIKATRVKAIEKAK